MLNAITRSRAQQVRISGKQYQTDSIGLQVRGGMILTSYPVDSNALHATDASCDDVLPPSLITFGPGNSVQAHVRPVHCVIPCEM